MTENYTLTPEHKRYWYNRGVQDARMCLPSRIGLLLSVSQCWHPEHKIQASTYYALGWRRTGRNRLKREYFQRAGIVL